MPTAPEVESNDGFAIPHIRTCVIVDDERMARKALMNMLGECCPDVQVLAEADSVESAVECITRLRPDIVLLDIEIIGGTGFDVLRQIPVVRKACVVMITAHQAYKQKIREMNIPCLYKPVNGEMLRQALESC